MWLFLAFLLIPIIEIGLFIQIGGMLGLWPTLGIVVLTAVLGTWLVRNQGLKVLQDLRGSLAQMNDPSVPLVHGAMILFAGALLLTPGFFTDAVGFLLLVPRLRVALFDALRARISIQNIAMGAKATQPNQNDRAHSDVVIDGEYEEIKSGSEVYSSHPNSKSPWRNH